MNASSEGNSDSVTIQDCRGLDVATIPGETLRAALRRFHVEGGAVLAIHELYAQWKGRTPTTAEVAAEPGLPASFVADLETEMTAAGLLYDETSDHGDDD